MNNRQWTDDESGRLQGNEPHAGVFVDPAISDQDGDDMPDDWEETCGLDTTSDDSAEDFDFDGDELRGVNKGILSDPLDPDTDADLVNDSADGQPLDASITASSPPVEMGQLQQSRRRCAATSPATAT